MPKMALCIYRADAPLAFNLAKAPLVIDHGPGFWHTPTELVDRAVCETDESTLQLIPYVVLAHVPHGVAYDKARIFAYSRGKGGAEERLHAKLSIGLGGHVDGIPGNGGLQSWLNEEACRELREEVGLDLPYSAVIFSNAVICDPTTEVSRVHIGVLCAVRVSPLELGASEKDVVESGQWLTLPELLAAGTFERLEPWSQAVAQYMARPLPVWAGLDGAKGQ